MEYNSLLNRTVVVTSSDNTYPRYKELLAKNYISKELSEKWQYDELPKNGDIGKVVGLLRRGKDSTDNILLVEIDNKTYMIKQRGLNFLNDIHEDNKDSQELQRLRKFKAYWDELYGTGLQVANWHQNSQLEDFDNFYDSAMDEYESEE